MKPFQLHLVPSDADWHTLNDGDEINRSNVTDEATDGFMIIASLEKVVHGQGANLNSFIGLHFILQGANENRRFKFVKITIRFEDEEQPLRDDDPEVIQAWPEGNYFWKGMSKEITDTKAAEGQLQGGQIVNGSLLGRWERQERFTKNTPATLSGTRRLLNRKKGANKNALVIRMRENTQEGSGVLRELRAGILVARRRPGNHRFKALISIETEADMRFRVVQGLKRLIGVQHITDPVILNPDVNFPASGDVAAGVVEEPNAKMMEAYGKAVSSIELTDLKNVG